MTLAGSIEVIDKLRDALLNVEFVEMQVIRYGEEITVEVCPWCNGEFEHKPTCPREAALRAADKW